MSLRLMKTCVIRGRGQGCSYRSSVEIVIERQCWDGKFGPKVGQIGPKWDKSGTFPDQISVHFGSVRQNILKSDLKSI